MATQLGRWRVSDVSGIPTTRIGASPGAYLRSPITDAAPQRRSRDQRQLLARFRQDGRDGTWTAEDGEGTRCAVETDPSGGFAIYAPGEAEGDQADPDIVGTAPPGANLDSLRRKIGPRPAHDQQQFTSVEQTERLRNWQQYLDKLWAPRS